MKAGGGFSWCIQSWVFFKSSKLYTVVQSFTSREYQNRAAGSVMTLKKSILFGCNFSLTLNKRTRRCSVFHHLCIKEALSCLGNLLQRLPVPVPPTAKRPPPHPPILYWNPLQALNIDDILLKPHKNKHIWQVLVTNESTNHHYCIIPGQCFGIIC